MAEKPSERFRLNNVDWKKIGKGAVIALVGALVTYAEQTIPLLDFGPKWTPVVVAVNAILVNAAYKWLSGPAK